MSKHKLFRFWNPKSCIHSFETKSAHTWQGLETTLRLISLDRYRLTLLSRETHRIQLKLFPDLIIPISYMTVSTLANLDRLFAFLLLPRSDNKWNALAVKISLSSCFTKTPSSLFLAVCCQLFLFHDYLITLNDPFVIRFVHSYNADSFIFDLRKFYDCLFWAELMNLMISIFGWKQ